MAGITEGGDWQFREVIKDRYKRLVRLRNNIWRTAVAQIAYVVLRTLWKSIPVFAAGASSSVVDEAILGGAAALFLLYHYAFGFGKPNRERMWAIKVYSIGCMVLIAEFIITSYKYHVLEGSVSRDPQLAAAYPPIPKAAAVVLHRRVGLQAGAAEEALALVEKALDVVGIAACAYGAYLTKEFVMEHKDQRREAVEGRGQGAKAE